MGRVGEAKRLVPLVTAWVKPPPVITGDGGWLGSIPVPVAGVMCLLGATKSLACATVCGRRVVGVGVAARVATIMVVEARTGITVDPLVETCDA